MTTGCFLNQKVMARPKANIDWNKVDQYLRAQCDGVGIAGIFGISPDTLYRACQEEFKIGFAEYSAQKKSEGKELLRAKQFSLAMEGDKTMCVWLGKQYLNQRDKQDIDQNTKVTTTPFTVTVLDGTKPE